MWHKYLNSKIVIFFLVNIFLLNQSHTKIFVDKLMWSNVQCKFSAGNGYCIHILNSKFYVNVLSTKLSTAVTFAFILELFTIHYMAHIKYTQFLPCKIPQISVGTLKTDTITTTKSSKKYLPTFLKILKNPNALNSI